MLERKLANVILNGVIVFGSVALGSKIKGLKNKIEMLTIQNKLQAIIIEAQQETVNKFIKEKKEKES